MRDIFDGEGNAIGSMELSERQLELLDKDTTITVQYHTPQLLRTLLGERSGAFSLHKVGDKIVARDPDALRQFAALQLDIRRASEARNAQGPGPAR